MDQLSKGIQKLILAGIGAAAVTKEKSEVVLDELVKKGEMTVEQGKVLNEELKRNVANAIRENVTVHVVNESCEDLLDAVDTMDDAQLEELKQRIAAREQAAQAVNPPQEENPDACTE